MHERRSGVHDRAQTARAIVDAQTTSSTALELLKEALARAGKTGPKTLALKRALRILECAEGVRTDEACLVLEIEKPQAKPSSG